MLPATVSVMGTLATTISVLVLPCITTAAPGPVPVLSDADNSYGDLLWSDEFDVDGRPDDLHWSYDVGGWGWGNGEFQAYREENAVVEDGRLKITAKRTSVSTHTQDGGHNFTSARLKTARKLSVQYGTIEARISVPDVYAGLWPAFWMLGESFPNVSWPACGELDIAEWGAPSNSVPNRLVVGAVHTERDGEHTPTSSWTTLPYDLNGTFHTYRMVWTPYFVRMTVDDEYVALYKDITPGSCVDCEALHQPQYILLNVAVGGNFTRVLGEPDNESRITASLPATMEVDYVRVFDNCFTHLSWPAVNGTINSSSSCEVVTEATMASGFRLRHVQVSIFARIAAVVAFLSNTGLQCNRGLF